MFFLRTPQWVSVVRWFCSGWAEIHGADGGGDLIEARLGGFFRALRGGSACEKGLVAEAEADVKVVA